MTEEYFDEDIAFTQSAIEKREQNLKNNPDEYTQIHLVYSTLFTYSYELLISKYSRGYNIESLRNDFTKVVSYWENYLNDSKHEEFLLEHSLEDFELALWLFSLAVLLKIDDKVIERLLKCINNNGKDDLFTQLISSYKKEKIEKAHLLVFPRVYESLYNSTTITAEAASQGIKSFLKDWYNYMQPCYWYENHTGKDGGGFFGYWCWEAALVTYLYDVDDSKYRDMPYYPKDIVDFARNKKILNEKQL